MTSSRSSATGDFPTRSPILLEEIEASRALRGIFFEAKLPKMSCACAPTTSSRSYATGDFPNLFTNIVRGDGGLPAHWFTSSWPYGRDAGMRGGRWPGMVWCRSPGRRGQQGWPGPWSLLCIGCRTRIEPKMGQRWACTVAIGRCTLGASSSMWIFSIEWNGPNAQSLFCR
jgi:hypothetical protein